MINGENLKNIPPRTNVIGVPISAVNMESSCDFLLNNFDKLLGNYICVSNVHTTVYAHDHPDYYLVQSNSLLTLPDGKPLSMVGKKKIEGMDRVTGPDFMRKIFDLSKVYGFKHFFYGTTDEDLQKLENKLKNDYPWLNIVGKKASVFRDLTSEEEESLINEINATEPDFVWVALGAPKQEYFCAKMEGKISAIMVGVGGAFKVLSGAISECPIWMQKLCLEWLYRLFKEPKRLFKRYFITNSKFIWYLIVRKKPKV